MLANCEQHGSYLRRRRNGIFPHCLFNAARYQYAWRPAALYRPAALTRATAMLASLSGIANISSTCIYQACQWYGLKRLTHKFKLLELEGGLSPVFIRAGLRYHVYAWRPARDVYCSSSSEVAGAMYRGVMINHHCMPCLLETWRITMERSHIVWSAAVIYH